MLILKTIFISIGLAFLAHRIAVMVFDFFCYGEIFGEIKLWIAKHVDPVEYEKNIDLIRNSNKQEAFSRAVDMYSEICNNSGLFAFFLRLLDCRFCLSIWTSLILTLSTLLLYDGLRIELLILVPVFAYFLTEKI